MLLGAPPAPPDPTLPNRCGAPCSGFPTRSALVTWRGEGSAARIGDKPVCSVAVVKSVGVVYGVILRGQAVRASRMGWLVTSSVVLMAWDLARTSRPR